MKTRFKRPSNIDMVKNKITFIPIIKEWTAIVKYKRFYFRIVIKEDPFHKKFFHGEILLGLARIYYSSYNSLAKAKGGMTSSLKRYVLYDFKEI